VATAGYETDGYLIPSRETNPTARAQNRHVPRGPPPRSTILGEVLKKGVLLGARALGHRVPSGTSRLCPAPSKPPRGVSPAPKESKETKAEPAAPAPPAGAEPSAEKREKKERPGRGKDAKEGKESKEGKEPKEGKGKGKGPGAKAPKFVSDNPNFRYIVRVSNSDLDGTRPAALALTGVSGVGLRVAEVALRLANVPADEMIGNLSEPTVEGIEATLQSLPTKLPAWMLNHSREPLMGETLHYIGPDLETRRRDDINIMRMVRSYRGVRHERGQKVRGQRTRSNGRTGMAAGVLKKEAKAAAAAAAGGKEEAAPAAAAPAKTAAPAAAAAKAPAAKKE
jgi:small subunit ribosomal protein S13